MAGVLLLEYHIWQVSSNRQQYLGGAGAPPGTLYNYYPTPVVDVVAPPAGPTEGGTLLRVYQDHTWCTATPCTSLSVHC